MDMTEPRSLPTEWHPLKRWRYEHGMNQVQFGMAIGVSAVQVSRIEARFATPSAKLTRRIREVTGLSLDEIFQVSPPSTLPPDGGDS